MTQLHRHGPPQITHLPENGGVERTEVELRFKQRDNKKASDLLQKNTAWTFARWKKMMIYSHDSIKIWICIQVNGAVWMQTRCVRSLHRKTINRKQKCQSARKIYSNRVQMDTHLQTSESHLSRCPHRKYGRKIPADYYYGMHVSYIWGDWQNLLHSKLR